MITDSFDNKTEEILKPWKKEDAKKVDAYLWRVFYGYICR